MTKAQFPDQGRPNSESPEDEREAGHREENLPNAEKPREENRGVDQDSIWRSIAALSKSRIESQLGEQPSANARPIRNALAELESRLARLSGEHRGADVEKTLRGLDQHLAEIAGRLDENAARGGVAKPAMTSGASGGSRFEALQRSIDSVTQGLDSFREDAAERGDQQLVMMRQIENVRRELQDVAQAIGELAPRASVAAIETAMGDLRQGIESQRGRGVPDETLAPAERIIGELRAVIEDLDPTPIVRNLRADVETIGFRLEKLQNGDVANASAVRDLARETHEIKEQLTALMARPLPLERIETRIIDVTQRVDALALSRGASGADLGEVVKAIRSIVAAETGKGLETFNKRLERLARKLDVVAEQSAAARFDEIGERIDELGKTLTQRIDRGAAANMAPLEALITTLAKKIDTALEGDGHASAFEEIGRRFDRFESRVVDSAPTESLARIEAMLAEQNAERQFADLAQRIDALRQTIAARLETPSGAGDSKNFAALENLVRGLDRKVDAAFSADARDLDLQAVERQLAQLSFKIDRLDDPFSAPRFGEQNARFDDIVERLDRMQAAFAQRVEDGARVEKREGELAALVGSLADRIKQTADSTADAGALKSLETQIGALAQRLERLDAGSGALIGFESKINDLFVRLEDTRSATTQAAEAAVRRAATEVLRDAGVQPAAVRVAVQRELNDILKTQDASGQRTNETLTAVHQMLERVVNRLGVFDDELTENRGVARRSTDAELGVELCGDDTRELVGASAAADAQDALSEALAPVDPMEFLLPVGDGVAERREPFIAPGPEADQAAHRSSIQSDFIAAARRAAQTPSAEAQSDEAARRAGQAQEKPQAAVVNFSALIQDRKRPLLLGLAAVMLLIGGYQIARMEGQGGLTVGPSLRQQEAKAPAKAVRPALSPEMRLASNRASSPAVAARPSTPGPVLKEPPAETASAQSVPRPLAAQRNIDPTPTGTIEAPPLSSGDALATIERLAVEGNPAAQYEMGARLVEGRGAARDAKAAAHWFEKAAEMGQALAQYRLGSMYERGVGVARDYARARQWYERAAESGNARAMHNVAVLLAEGGDGKPDYAAAAEWFRRAAEYGIRDSQFNLGILYARGLGISRDLQQSYVWFSAAADQGDEDAAKKRDEIGARLDSKELAAAKALAAAFRAKLPTSEANDAPAIRTGGGEGAREQTPVKPAPKSTSGKPRVSQL